MTKLSRWVPWCIVPGLLALAFAAYSQGTRRELDAELEELKRDEVVSEAANEALTRAGSALTRADQLAPHAVLHFRVGADGPYRCFPGG